MKIELNDNAMVTIIAIGAFIAFIVMLIVLDGCTSVPKQLTYWAEHGPQVNTLTGEYTLIKASCPAVQNVWESRVEPARRHMKVESFLDYDRKEIWYCTSAGLRKELDNAQSPKSLNRAYKEDIEIAFPAIQPPETRRNR